MTDRLHDHTTIGFRRGCVACAQTEADMRRASEAYRRSHPVTSIPIVKGRGSDAEALVHL